MTQRSTHFFRWFVVRPTWCHPAIHPASPPPSRPKNIGLSGCACRRRGSHDRDEPERQRHEDASRRHRRVWRPGARAALEQGALCARMPEAHAMRERPAMVLLRGQEVHLQTQLRIQPCSGNLRVHTSYRRHCCSQTGCPEATRLSEAQPRLRQPEIAAAALGPRHDATQRQLGERRA